MTTTKNCLLCYNEFDEGENTHCYSSKLSELCCKYLHSAITQEYLLSQPSHQDLPFCPKCFKSALELVDINDQMEFCQKRISELVLVLSLEILHRRGQTTLSSDKVTADNAQNLIAFDVSSFPTIESWNNSSFTGGNSISPIIKPQISENFNEEEVSEPLLIPSVLPEGNENSIIDIVIEEMKFEDLQNDFMDVIDDAEEISDLSAAEFLHSVGNEMEETVKNVSTVPVEKELPTVKLQRLQFYDMEENVIDMGNGTVSTIIVNDQIGRTKFHTVWSKCDLGDSYRFSSINKHLSSETSSEDLKSRNNFPISNATENSFPASDSSSDEEILDCGDMLETNVLNTNPSISSFDKQNCHLNPKCDKILKTKLDLLEPSKLHERPYSCKFCDRRFETRISMISHRKCHHYDVKPFVGMCLKADTCPMCKKIFKVKLDRHIKEVHFGVPRGGQDELAKCEHCDHFGLARNMKMHIQRKHQDVKNGPQ